MNDQLLVVPAKIGKLMIGAQPLFTQIQAELLAFAELLEQTA